MQHAIAVTALMLFAACTSTTPAPTCPHCCAFERAGTGSFGGTTFNDHNDDGLPDDPAAAVCVDTDGDRVQDLIVRLGALFADTDDDGVPDTRVLALGAGPDGYVRASIARASMDVVRAADRQQLDAALDAMADAIANARRELGRKR